MKCPRRARSALDETFDFRLGRRRRRSVAGDRSLETTKKVASSWAGRARGVPQARLRDIERLFETFPRSQADLRIARFAPLLPAGLGEVLAASLPPRCRCGDARCGAIPPVRRRLFGASPVDGGPGSCVRDVLARASVVHNMLQGVTDAAEARTHHRGGNTARPPGALLLVPEIALTPNRAAVAAAFPSPIHHAASPAPQRGERAKAWLATQSDRAKSRSERACNPDAVRAPWARRRRRGDDLRTAAGRLAVSCTTPYGARRSSRSHVLSSTTHSWERRGTGGTLARIDPNDRAVTARRCPWFARRHGTDRPQDGITHALAGCASAWTASEAPSHQPPAASRRCCTAATAAGLTCTRQREPSAAPARWRAARHHCGHRERAPAGPAAGEPGDLAGSWPGISPEKSTKPCARDALPRRPDEALRSARRDEILAKRRCSERATTIRTSAGGCPGPTVPPRGPLGRAPLRALVRWPGRGEDSQGSYPIDFPIPLWRHARLRAPPDEALEERASRVPPFRAPRCARRTEARRGAATCAPPRAGRHWTRVRDLTRARPSARSGFSGRSSWCARALPCSHSWPNGALAERDDRRVRWSLDVDPQEV